MVIFVGYFVVDMDFVEGMDLVDMNSVFGMDSVFGIGFVDMNFVGAGSAEEASSTD